MADSWPDGLEHAKPFSLLELETEITTLAANINAAMFRFLRLVAEFDRREGWEGPGLLSCAHWLNWRCGVALGAAREKLRVAHALDALPQVCARFAAGELSYSKVRALTRVATPQNEAYLLQIARHGTAAHLEKLVRGYRRSLRLAEAERAEATHAHRYVRYFYDEDGSLVVQARLAPEAGAALVHALEQADRSLRADGNIEALEAAERRSWFGEPVVDRVSAETRREPPADVSAETSVADVDAEPIEIASFEQRRADALALLAQDWLRHGAAESGRADAYQVMLHVDATAYVDYGEGRCDAEDGPPIPVETLRRLGCDVGVLVAVEDGAGNVLSVGRKSRAIAPALRRALRARDGGCRFPGCTAARYVDGHHIEHWAAGGATRLDNLVLLCGRHHRLVHEGGWTVRVAPDGTLDFRSPRHDRVLESPALPAAGERIELGNARLGLSIDADTAIPQWHGERMDLSLAVGHLWACADDARPGA